MLYIRILVIDDIISHGFGRINAARATLKSWEWPGGVANRTAHAYEPFAHELYILKKSTVLAIVVLLSTMCKWLVVCCSLFLLISSNGEGIINECVHMYDQLNYYDMCVGIQQVQWSYLPQK